MKSSAGRPEPAAKPPQMVPFADLHCDTAIRIARGSDVSIKTKKGHVDIPRLRVGGITTQVFAVFIGPGGEEAYWWSHCVETINAVKEQFARLSDDVRICTDSRAIESAHRAGKIAAILSVEGAHPLGSEPKRLDELYELGVRALGLTWENSNDFASSAQDEESGSGSGLTPLGRKLVARMNALGMIVDVSHSGEKTFWDCIKLSGAPIIASHSCARALCDHYRNLTDEQIRALSDKGGVIGVNFYPRYLVKRGSAYVATVIRHIQHFVEVGGIECAAIGSDFDGIPKLPIGLEDCSKMQIIALGLSKEGLSDSDIHKIASGNFLRVFKAVCG
jgi:membrane dipeptidase